MCIERRTDELSGTGAFINTDFLERLIPAASVVRAKN
jgi:hypothetical protein